MEFSCKSPLTGEVASSAKAMRTSDILAAAAKAAAALPTPSSKSSPPRPPRCHAVIRARDQEHAIELANVSEYGLSAAVFTRYAARGLSVMRRIHSGICHVNGPTVHDEAQMPFGGVGASGYGRFWCASGDRQLHRNPVDHG